VEITEGRGGGKFPPRFFGKTDAVLPTNDAAHLQNATEQFVEDSMHPAIVRLRPSRSHQVDVNVAVSRMTKAGNRNTVLFLESRGQPKEIHYPAPRNGYVLIQFHEPCVSEGVAKSSANLPDLFASGVAVSRDNLGRGGTQNLYGGGKLTFDGGGLAVKFNDKHRIAVGSVGNRFSGSGEGERVGNLEGAGEKSRAENLLDSSGGFGNGGELGPQAGAGGRKRD